MRTTTTKSPLLYYRAFDRTREADLAVSQQKAWKAKAGKLVSARLYNRSISVDGVDVQLTILIVRTAPDWNITAEYREQLEAFGTRLWTQMA